LPDSQEQTAKDQTLSMLLFWFSIWLNSLTYQI